MKLNVGPGKYLYFFASMPLYNNSWGCTITAEASHSSGQPRCCSSLFVYDYFYYFSFALYMLPTLWSKPRWSSCPRNCSDLQDWQTEIWINSKRMGEKVCTAIVAVFEDKGLYTGVIENVGQT